MQTLGVPVSPPPLKERPHENVESTWLEMMIISVDLSDIFYFLLFALVLFSPTRDVPGKRND